jgi:hypothetical protein
MEDDGDADAVWGGGAGGEGRDGEGCEGAGAGEVILIVRYNQKFAILLCVPYSLDWG